MASKTSKAVEMLSSAQHLRPKKRAHKGYVNAPEGTSVGNRKAWAQQINARWNTGAASMVRCVIDLGRLLRRARDDLDHGQFLKMIESDLEFSRHTANAFMRIERWTVEHKIKAHQAQSLLPPDWTAIDKLTRLDDTTFATLLNKGRIHREMRRSEVAKILRVQRVKDDERRVARLVPAIGRYKTIVLDPPWEYDWLSEGARARPGYAMQSIDELMKLDVRGLWADATACHLYCWTTNNFMAEACKLVAHWGFQHRSVLTWVKPSFGNGSYFRNSTEHVLFATFGDTTTREAANSIPTHFEAPRGKHSEKPEAFYEIVRAASFPPYGEGNQRRRRPDFHDLFKSIPEQEQHVESQLQQTAEAVA